VICDQCCNHDLCMLKMLHVSVPLIISPFQWPNTENILSGFVVVNPWKKYARQLGIIQRHWWNQQPIMIIEYNSLPYHQIRKTKKTYVKHDKTALGGMPHFSTKHMFHKTSIPDVWFHLLIWWVVEHAWAT